MSYVVDEDCDKGWYIAKGVTAFKHIISYDLNVVTTEEYKFAVSIITDTYSEVFFLPQTVHSLWIVRCIRRGSVRYLHKIGSGSRIKKYWVSDKLPQGMV